MQNDSSPFVDNFQVNNPTLDVKSRMSNRDRKKMFVHWLSIIVVLLLSLIITRGISLSHGIDLHADEHCFANSASSVVQGDYKFKPAKDYPNGAFVYYMPFQFAGEIVARKLGRTNILLFNRIGAFFYFVLGSLVGLFYIRKKTNDYKCCFIFIGIIVFSLLHIEQSRYGTGEPISFFLILSIIVLLDRFLSDNDNFALYFASFLTGSLVAVKYSLIIFSVLLLAAIFVKKKQGNNRLMQICFSFVLMLLGLLVFSPAFFQDSSHFMKAFFSEFNMYVIHANRLGKGNPLTHLMSTLIYALLYSDFPFGVIFAVYGVYHLFQIRKARSDLFFSLVLPIFSLLFLLFNIFASTLFFRSIYPFFLIANLYATIGLHQTIQKLSAKQKKIPSLLFLILTIFFVVRGVMFVADLSGPSRKAQAIKALQSHPEWEQRNKTIVIGEHYAPTFQQRVYTYPMLDLTQNGKVQLQEGEFLVTSAVTNNEVKFRPFDFRPDPTIGKIETEWATFEQKNRSYLFATITSSFEHAFYGAWVHGSTLPAFEFPAYQLYYKPKPNKISDSKLLGQYSVLYSCYDPTAYFNAIAKVDSAVVFVNAQGSLTSLKEETDKLLNTFSMLNMGRDEYYLGVLRSNGQPLWEKSGSDPFDIDLMKNLSLPCFMSADIYVNKIIINDRDYCQNMNGLNIAIYDSTLNTCVDWFTLVLDENTLAMLR